MLYLKSNVPEKFNRLRAQAGDDVLPDEMREQSIEIYECDMSIESNDLASPMIPNKNQRTLNLGDNIPEWAMSVNYKSKTQRRARKTILQSNGDQKKYIEQEEELLKADRYQKSKPSTTPVTRDSSAHKSKGAFDGIGDHLGDDDQDLSEIRLDMKEGG